MNDANRKRLQEWARDQREKLGLPREPTPTEKAESAKDKGSSTG